MNKKNNNLISKVLLPLFLVPTLYFAKPGEVKGEIKEFPQTQQINVTINENETENITIPLTLNIYNQGATKADSTPAKVDTVYKIIKEPVQPAVKDSASSILELEEMPGVYSEKEGVGSHTIKETPTPIEKTKITKPKQTLIGLINTYDEIHQGIEFGLLHYNKDILDDTNAAVLTLGINDKVYSNPMFNITGSLEGKAFNSESRKGFQFNPEIQVFGNTFGTGFGFIVNSKDGKEMPTYLYLLGKAGIGGKDLAAEITARGGSSLDMDFKYSFDAALFCQLNPDWRVKIQGGKGNFNDLLRGNDGYFDMTVLNGKENEVQYGLNLGIQTPLGIEEIYRKSDETTVDDIYKNVVLSAGPRVYIPLEQELKDVKKYIELGLDLGAQFNGQNKTTVGKIGGHIKARF